jgi:hybrid cluster-associated redox disulfide protein
MMAEITADTMIRDVLLGYPHAADVFDRHGLACASCLASGLETVSAVAAMHDVSVDALLAELNQLPVSSAPEELR